ncbi:MAG TPA: cupin domain-containing protein [Gaiellaceae bacterium]|nr:cupin domain-containing protein [Gaiellaceae bacterium]
MPRAEPGRYDDLLALADVERMLCSGGLRHPAFRLVKTGERLGLGDYATDVPWRPVSFTGTIDVPSALAAFARGATIVLQALHHTHPPLAAFCRSLELELEQPVQANAYFTPRGSQGLPVHHDTHDVFCLQVAGRKRWLVYEPALELPLRDQRYRPELGSPGRPVLDLVLEPGDTLYMPRGWLHEALTSDEDSLHITIGVNLYTWLDAVRAAVDACADELEFRRSVPADGARGADLLGALEARLQPADVARRRRSKLVRTRRPVLADGLSELRASDSLTTETMLERRPTVLSELEDGALVFEGKRLRVPTHALPALRAVAESERPFRAADLPGELDDDGRLVLLRRLIREGFVRRSATGG